MSRFSVTSSRHSPVWNARQSAGIDTLISSPPLVRIYRPDEGEGEETKVGSPSASSRRNMACERSSTRQVGTVDDSTTNSTYRAESSQEGVVKVKSTPTVDRLVLGRCSTDFLLLGKIVKQSGLRSLRGPDEVR